jgi:hypothetical protein
MDKINLTKKGFEKTQYKRVIDTSFKQLISPPTVEPIQTTAEKIVAFFAQYEDLFYEIPKEGETNSHEYLIKQSTAYTNFELVDEDVKALLDEIASLRERNLELEQQIINQRSNGLSISSVSSVGLSDNIN